MMVGIILAALGVGIIVGAITGWVTYETLFGVIAGIVTFVVVGAIGFGVTVGYSNPRDLTCTVENKDRTQKDSGSDARVYTTECGVLNVQDLLWAREFNSADQWSKIQPGHTYRFHVTGVRIGFFDMFPHIRSVSEVAK